MILAMSAVPPWQIALNKDLAVASSPRYFASSPFQRTRRMLRQAKFRIGRLNSRKV